MAKDQNESWRPNQMQELLLRAALGTGDEARIAWDQWIDQVDLTNLDYGSQRVLPLLYHNLRFLGITHPATNRLSQAYKNAWANNQVLLHQLEEVVTEFEKKGIPTILLKGAAMVTHYYQDAAQRSMTDFDILVPVDKCDAAIAALAEMGWRSPKRTLEKLSAHYRVAIHGMSFVRPGRHGTLDLHWHAFHHHLHEQFDEFCWQAAIPVQLGATTTHVLCPADQIIHSCVHGIENELSDNIRWLPDVLTVFARGSEIDWPRFVRHCRRLEVTMPLAAMMEYVRTTWNAPVPEQVISELAHSPTSAQSQQMYHDMMKYAWQLSWNQMLRLRYRQYLYTMPSGPVWSRPLGFLRFLSQRWTTDSPQSALAGAFTRLVTRLRKNKEFRSR